MKNDEQLWQEAMDSVGAKNYKETQESAVDEIRNRTIKTVGEMMEMGATPESIYNFVVDSSRIMDLLGEVTPEDLVDIELTDKEKELGNVELNTWEKVGDNAQLAAEVAKEKFNEFMESERTQDTIENAKLWGMTARIKFERKMKELREAEAKKKNDSGEDE